MRLARLPRRMPRWLAPERPRRDLHGSTPEVGVPLARSLGGDAPMMRRSRNAQYELPSGECIRRASGAQFLITRSRSSSCTMFIDGSGLDPSWRRRARAWWRSERAVPSGMPSMRPISDCLNPSMSCRTITARCRSPSVVQACRNGGESSDSPGSRNGDAIVSASASASRTFFRRVMSRGVGDDAMQPWPNAWSGRTIERAIGVEEDLVRRLRSSCVRTIARATAYARR